MRAKSNTQPRRRLLNLAVLAALGGGALAPASASAANLYWVCGSAAWSTVNCWSSTPGGAPILALPQNLDNAYLTQTDATDRVVSNNAFSGTLNSLSIDATGTGTMTFRQNSLTSPVASAIETVGINGTGYHTQVVSTNTVSSALYLGYNSGGNGTYNLSGGGLFHGVLSGNFEFVGYSGTGTFNQTLGTNTASSLNLGANSGSHGTYNLSGGSLSANSETIGLLGTGIFAQSGGTNTVGTNLFLGYLAGGSGTYQLSGTGSLSATSEVIGRSGVGTFNQSGGTNTVSGNLNLGLLGGGSGTYNLSGGTLNVGGITNGAGASTFNLDGGTLNLYGTSISLDSFYIGRPSGSNGSFTLGSGKTFTTRDEYNGSSGTGTFNQTGGTHTVSNALIFGLSSGGNGTYNLSAGDLSAGLETIGYYGTGAFNQTGGTHIVSNDITLGFHIGGNGSYNLSAGSLSAGFENIGADGTGTFTQSGGTHTVGNTLYLGSWSGGNGTYNLSAGSLSATSEHVGSIGTGTFNQSGGTHTVSNDLTLGYWSGSSGTYNLSGGTLDVGGIADGLGSSTFNLDGGTLNLTGSLITLDNFNIGNASGSNGSFTLGIGQSLTAANETIGHSGGGALNQTGGTHTVSGVLQLGTLSGSGGTYTQSGGVLNVGSIANGAGLTIFNLDGGTLNLTGSSIGLDRFYIGSAVGSNSSFTLGVGQTTDTSYEYIGNSGTGAFTQNGGVHTVGGTLYLGRDSGGNGSYNLNAGSLSVTASAMVGGNGTGAINQTGGTNAVGSIHLGYLGGSNGTYNLSSGSLSAAYETIGGSGTGTFSQSGGTNTVSNVIFEIGREIGGNGTYNLSGGDLSARFESIGVSGTGTFNQSGISSHTASSIYLGANSGSNGTYNLSAGTLSAADETIGYSGTGIFNQSGGTHTVSTTLVLGPRSGGSGTYNLSGGTLNVGDISHVGHVIDVLGTSTFNLDGGTLNLTGSSISLDHFRIGNAVGSNGSFTLGVGQTTYASYEYIGNSGTGAFTQNGGAHTVGLIHLGYLGGSSGTYNLSNGSLSAIYETIGGSGTGIFNQSGGTNTVSGDLTLGQNIGSVSTYTLGGGVLSVGGNIGNGGGVSTLNINGGSLSVGLGNGSIGVDTLVLGSAGGSNGSHTLSGTGSILAGNETIGGRGTGTINQTGGTHTVTGEMALAANTGSSGTYNLTGGTLTVLGGITNNAGGSFTVGAGTTATVGGTGFVNYGLLSGTGTVVGNVISSGNVGPGNSPGMLSITGDYSQTMLGTFTAEIGGLLAGSQYDVLNVSGTATLDGLLNVALFDFGVGLFAPSAGDYFDILTASTITGSFSSMSFAALSNPNLFWQIAYLTDAIGTTDVVRLSVASNIAPPPAVPEPETYAMLLAGLGLLGFMGRRRNGGSGRAA